MHAPASRTAALIKSGKVADVSVTAAQKNYKKALEKGLLKILSKARSGSCCGGLSCRAWSCLACFCPGCTVGMPCHSDASERNGALALCGADCHLDQLKLQRN